MVVSHHARTRNQTRYSIRTDSALKLLSQLSIPRYTDFINTKLCTNTTALACQLSVLVHIHLSTYTQRPVLKSSLSTEQIHYGLITDGLFHISNGSVLVIGFLHLLETDAFSSLLSQAIISPCLSMVIQSLYPLLLTKFYCLDLLIAMTL